MKNKVLKIVIITIILSLLGSLIFLFFQKRILNKTYNQGESQNSISPKAEERQGEYVHVDPNEHVPNKILETREITGIVIEIFDPVNAVDGERILTVQADVIDIDKIKEIDFSKETADLPMTKKEYKLKADDKTKFIKGGLKGLRPGDFAYIKTSDSIYSGNKLSAEEITILNLPK